MIPVDKGTKFLPINFIGISPNPVCFKYAFFQPCEARYQLSSGEESELQSEEAWVQILVGAVLFVISGLGDDEICEWVVGEKGNGVTIFSFFL